MIIGMGYSTCIQVFCLAINLDHDCHIYCEATHVCYIEDAREVTHVILMLFVEQG